MTTDARQTSVLAAATLLVVASLAHAQDQDEGVKFAEHMPLADESLVLDAVPTDFGAVAVGAHGHVLLTGDFQEWRQAESVPTRSTLTAVDFVGRQGWAVGHDSVILHSTDAGGTWERQYFAPDRQQPFMDVMFLDADRGYAVGAYDLYMTTDNGGKTWTDTGGVDPDNDWHLNSILKADDGNFYIAAEQGLVYRSGDGESWDRIQLPYEGSMFGALQAAPGRVLVFGLRGHAFQTTDGGMTWEPVDTGTDSSLFGGRVLQGGTIVLAGNGGTYVTSSPGGDAFTAHRLAEGEPLAGALRSTGGSLVFYGVTGIGDEQSEGGEE